MTSLSEYLIDLVENLTEENVEEEVTSDPSNPSGNLSNNQNNETNLEDLLYPVGRVIPRECPPLPKEEFRLQPKSKRDPTAIVLMKNKDSEPLNITSLITSVSVSESEDSHTTCTLVFKPVQRENVNNSIFNARNEVDIYIGYISEDVVFFNTFILDKPKIEFGEEIIVTMSGKDIGMQLSEGEEQNVYNGMSDLEVINEIAGNKFLVISDINKINPSIYEKYDSITQAGISKLELAKYRAILHGFTVDITHHIDNGEMKPAIYFGPPRNCDSGVVLHYRDDNPDKCTIMKFVVTEETYKKGCVVTVPNQDPERIGPQPGVPIPGIEFTIPEIDQGNERPFRLIGGGRQLEPDLSNLEEIDFEPPFFQCVQLEDDHPLQDSFNTDRTYYDIRNESFLNTADQQTVQNFLSRGLGSEEIREIINQEEDIGNEDFSNIIPEQIEQAENSCQMIINGVGHRENFDEQCRISKSIHESIQFIVKANIDVAVGDPRIRKGHLLTVKGVGKYSGKYYIKTVTHTVDESGYKLSNLTVKSRGTQQNSNAEIIPGDVEEDRDIILFPGFGIDITLEEDF